MLKPQKKISIKEIKEDQLVTGYFEARAWVEDHKRIASYVVLAIVAIPVLWFLWHSRRVDADQTTTTQLAKVISFYDAGQYSQAVYGVPQQGVQGLQAIVDENGSTVAGETAKLYLANSYFALKQYDYALKYYDDVSLSDPFLTASAYAGVGACYEAKGDYADAAKKFERAASKSDAEYSAPDNLQRAAVNYAASGNKEKAIELLKKLKNDFPNTAAARNADIYIAEYSV
jgi:tetratricopeptide (TPR) repeat protein